MYNPGVFQGGQRQGQQFYNGNAMANVPAQQGGMLSDPSMVTAPKNAGTFRDCTKCCKPRNLLIAKAITLAAGVALAATAVGAPYWASAEVTVNSSSIRLYIGLWQKCLTISGNDCKLEDTVDSSNEDWYRICQSFGVLGGILAVGALAVMLFWWCCEDTASTISKMMIIALSIVSVGCLAVTVGLFAANHEDFGNTLDLDWCFGLACAAAGLILIAPTLIIFIPSSPKQHQQQNELQQMQQQYHQYWQQMQQQYYPYWQGYNTANHMAQTMPQQPMGQPKAQTMAQPMKQSIPQQPMTQTMAQPVAQLKAQLRTQQKPRSRAMLQIPATSYGRYSQQYNQPGTDWIP